MGLIIRKLVGKNFHSNKLEEVLTYFTEEQIMEVYLRPPSSLVFCNPFRIDNNPSCTLNWYKGRLLFKDWTLGFTWDIVGVAGLKLGILSPLEDPVTSIKGKYSIIVESIYDELVKGKDLPKIDTKYSNINNTNKNTIKKVEVVRRNWDKYDLDYWELPTETLEKHHIYPILYGLINGDVVMVNSVNCPTYAYYFPDYSTKNNGVWKLYSPKTKQFNKPKWLGNVKAEMIFKTW